MWIFKVDSSSKFLLQQLLIFHDDTSRWFKLKLFLLKKTQKHTQIYINKAETQLGLFASVQFRSLTRDNTTFTTDRLGW